MPWIEAARAVLEGARLSKANEIIGASRPTEGARILHRVLRMAMHPRYGIGEQDKKMSWDSIARAREHKAFWLERIGALEADWRNQP